MLKLTIYTGCRHTICCQTPSLPPSIEHNGPFNGGKHEKLGFSPPSRLDLVINLNRRNWTWIFTIVDAKWQKIQCLFSACVPQALKDKRRTYKTLFQGTSKKQSHGSGGQYIRDRSKESWNSWPCFATSTTINHWLLPFDSRNFVCRRKKKNFDSISNNFCPVAATKQFLRLLVTGAHQESFCFFPSPERPKKHKY